MKTNLTMKDLMVVEEVLKSVHGASKDYDCLTLKVRKELGESLPISEDNSITNITKRLGYYVAQSFGMDGDQVHMGKDWIRFVGRRVVLFVDSYPNKVDENLVKEIAIGNAKDFIDAHRKDLTEEGTKAYQELYAALQTWITAKNGEGVPSKKAGCIVNVLTLVVLALIVFVGFLNGRFGKRKLVKPLIYLWRVFWWGLFIWAVFEFVAVPFFAWWDRVVAGLNYLVWG